ncbi:MAG: hypothetical protein KJP26_07540 [Maribacter sp.]|nr:hypothetical protein [Maribacter sp.]
MKIFLVLFVLPLLVFGQPIQDPRNDFIPVALRVEINIQSEIEEQLNSHQFEKYSVVLLVNLRMPIKYNQENWAPLTKLERPLPKHLNTISLSGSHLEKHRSFKPQERLDHLLALNDPDYPKQNTFLKGLSPVRYDSTRFGGIEKIPEGFGPKIRL